MARSVCILGGGVAGLASAIALAQRGFSVEVIERHGGPTTLGAGIVCWPNAAFVLYELGVHDAVAASAGRLRGMRRRASTGEELGLLDVSRLSERMGAPAYSILRRDLLEALNDRAREVGVDVRFSQTVTRLTSDDGHARVELADGSVRQADIVLGADGRMRSVARDFVTGDATPIYQGFVNWIGVFESVDPLFLEMEVLDFWGVGLRFGIVPISPTRGYFAGGASRARVRDRDQGGHRQRLLDLFGGWPEPVAAVLAGATGESIREIYVHDLEPIERWHRDNVLLIGDAAHAALPTSGQGACQALEDAWHLADLLGDEGKVDDAFATFTARRLEKTSGMSRGARQLARVLFDTDPGSCRLRNERSRRADYAAMVDGMARGWSEGLPRPRGGRVEG